MPSLPEFQTRDVYTVIRRALVEDVGTGDVTSNSIIPAEARMDGQIIAKQKGIIAGLDVAEAVYRTFDSRKPAGIGESFRSGAQFADR